MGETESDFQLTDLHRPLQHDALIATVLGGTLEDTAAVLPSWCVAQMRTFCPGAFNQEHAPEKEVAFVWRALESVNVTDLHTNRVAFQLYLWPTGCAALFRDRDVVEIGYAVQHSFKLAEPNGELHKALGLAFVDATGTLSIQTRIDF